MAGWDRPPKTAEEGADTPLYLAMLEVDGTEAPTGLFFQKERNDGGEGLKLSSADACAQHSAICNPGKRMIEASCYTECKRRQ